MKPTEYGIQIASDLQAFFEGELRPHFPQVKGVETGLPLSYVAKVLADPPTPSGSQGWCSLYVSLFEKDALPSEKLQTLASLADECLFFLGMYRDSLEVTRTAQVASRLGKTAYFEASRLCQSGANADLFASLSAHFEPITVAVTELCDRYLPPAQKPEDLLRYFKRWMEMPNPRLERILREGGFPLWSSARGKR